MVEKYRISLPRIQPDRRQARIHHSSFETKCDMVMKQLQFRCKDLKSKGYVKLHIFLELLVTISDACAFYKQSYGQHPMGSAREIAEDPHCHISGPVAVSLPKPAL